MALIGELYAAQWTHLDGSGAVLYHGYVKVSVPSTFSGELWISSATREGARKKLLDSVENTFGIPRHLVEESLDKGLVIDVKAVPSFLLSQEQRVKAEHEEQQALRRSEQLDPLADIPKDIRW